MSDKKICVYTCITGNYDDLKEIDKNVFEKNIDYYCFTNNKNIKSDTWNIIFISDDSLDDHMLSRKIKILGHEKINKNYDISVWIDGSIKLNKKITEFLQNECNLEKNDICCFKHSTRNCIYEEAKECIRLMKDDINTIKKQVTFLKKEKYPENYGLCEMGIFARNLKSEELHKTMELWFDMLLKYSKRDQLSFMYCIYKTNVKIKQIDLNIYNNDYFLVEQHNIISNIVKYRVYYKDLSESKEEFDFCDKYKITKNTYKASFVLNADTNLINFQVSNICGILIDKINFYFENKFKLINIFKMNQNYIIFNEIGIVQLFGDFKKNDIIEIELIMKKMDDFTFSIIMKSYYDNDISQSKYIKSLEKKINQLERRIRMKNKDYDDILTEHNKVLKDHKELEKHYIALNNNYDILQNNYDFIVNSKGWKMLEKFRNLKK